MGSQLNESRGNLHLFDGQARFSLIRRQLHGPVRLHDQRRAGETSPLDFSTGVDNFTFSAASFASPLQTWWFWWVWIHWSQMKDSQCLVGVVQPGGLLLNCLALWAFVIGDCLVYLLGQWKLSEVLCVRLYVWTGWLLVLYVKKACDLVLVRALHKKTTKGAYCFCLGMICIKWGKLRGQWEILRMLENMVSFSHF